MRFEEDLGSKSKGTYDQVFTGRGADIWSGAVALLSLLNDVVATTIRELSAAATTIALPARRVIYKLGGRSRGLYVVLSGRVKLTLPMPHSRPRIVAPRGPGAWFGETALLLQEPHAIGAEAAEPVMLGRIVSATVTRLLHADNVFALKLLKETSRRLRTSMLDTTASSSLARDRVIGYLLDSFARRRRDHAKNAVSALRCGRLLVSIRRGDG